MTRNMDFSNLVPIQRISGESEEDTRLLRKMAGDAERFLRSFEWCKDIERGWFGWGVGGIAAVFLFELSPSAPEVDTVLWVVVGDLPPAYLVVADSPAPLEALGTYVELMEAWIAAVRDGRSTEECIAVHSTSPREAADALELRINFLKREFLSEQRS